ncbi:hypothetical protein [Listeria booriae]|uniref:hypothetical protein n=1 Tax=Listeria booriae TaxID=1552123 RepID=UPI001628B8B6|nr:hypothetical protein [Listeria booriae]MBC1502706.1 hypothetical protein [Listeria booriae]MBC1513744.1 hypothetical protein [Listeria booriae]MBC6152737.1 hypothetical protein [Listeria booriae]MBC6307028.1 hypothetical protein [Listeria booriae]MDT0108915.1 hypothetical protein [Listeria booriae]
MENGQLEKKLKRITKITFRFAISIPISIVFFVILGFVLALGLGMDRDSILLFIKSFMLFELFIYLINWGICLKHLIWLSKFKRDKRDLSMQDDRLMNVIRVALILFIIPFTVPFAMILLGTANKLTHGKFSVNRLSGLLYEKYIMVTE